MGNPRTPNAEDASRCSVASIWRRAARETTHTSNVTRPHQTGSTNLGDADGRVFLQQFLGCFDVDGRKALAVPTPLRGTRQAMTGLPAGTAMEGHNSNVPAHKTPPEEGRTGPTRSGSCRRSAPVRHPPHQSPAATPFTHTRAHAHTRTRAPQYSVRTQSKPEAHGRGQHAAKFQSRVRANSAMWAMHAHLRRIPGRKHTRTLRATHRRSFSSYEHSERKCHHQRSEGRSWGWHRGRNLTGSRNQYTVTQCGAQLEAKSALWPYPAARCCAAMGRTVPNGSSTCSTRKRTARTQHTHPRRRWWVLSPCVARDS